MPVKPCFQAYRQLAQKMVERKRPILVLHFQESKGIRKFSMKELFPQNVFVKIFFRQKWNVKKYLLHSHKYKRHISRHLARLSWIFYKMHFSIDLLQNNNLYLFVWVRLLLHFVQNFSKTKKKCSKIFEKMTSSDWLKIDLLQI